MNIPNKATEIKAAVKSFQQYMNESQNAHLAVDGICGSKTFAYLDRTDIAYKPVSSPSPTAENLTVGPTSSYAAVRELQYKLISLGWLTGNADGIYSYDTYNAVRDFQRRNGLTADGIAGEKTFEKLFDPLSPLRGTSP